LDRPTALALTRVAAAEARRAKRQMRVPGFPRPYFISYMLRDEERWCLKAKFGALKVRTHDRSRNAFADVRVGSYSYDQIRDGGLLDNDKDSESYGYVDLPYGGRSHDGVRHGLWRLTDARFREAVEALLDKKSRELTYRNPGRHFKAFERRKPAVDLRWTPFPELDVDAWARFVERASAVLKRFPDVKDSQVEFEADHICRMFVSSEGARRIQCHAIWSVECYLWLLSDGGDGIPWTVKHTVANPTELPSIDSFLREIRKTVGVLRKLAQAPTLRSFSGPALLEPVPAGLLMHEAVGHRLEGSRLLASGEGQTFKDSVGKQILPDFLSIRENPLLERYGKHSLIGHYRYDDEGVEAQNTPLVVDGVLERFMATRMGISRRHHSSGHARSAYHQRPISRMGVTLVESSNGLDRRALKRKLLEEIRRRGAPFGIRIIEASSGETATEAYNFQAFLGEINLASKIYPDGHEEWIRGVNFVGTPLNAIGSIVAAGDRSEVDNAYCGAESGYVPVTTISPALLVSELELQSKADTPYSPYTFPIPWERARRPRSRQKRRLG
jgi:predicted Zn-dependent protease